ncbi:MAG: hypothetical protein ACK4X1_04685, partial [Terricaulis sp.]
MIIRCFCIALLALAYGVTPANAQSDLASLEGVWTTRLDMGPELHGELSIHREAGGWRAVIGGNEVRSEDLQFAFANDGGRFEGRGDWGWWIQPPGLSGVSYATPVGLHAGPSGSLYGVLQPLPQTFTLHLALLRGEEGNWLAAFRNPEFNMNGGASRLS